MCYTYLRGDIMPSVNDILKNENELSFICGKDGLNKKVSRAHMVENIEIARSFISQGELIFTTGSGFSSQDELEELVLYAKKACASGIIVNIGPYINSITNAVINFCEKESLPLFSCSWDVHMANIMSRVGFLIENQAEKNKNEIIFFENLLDKGQPSRSLNSIGLDDNSFFYLAISNKSGGVDKKLCTIEKAGFYISIFCNIPLDVVKKNIKSGFVISNKCTVGSLYTSYKEAVLLFKLNSNDNSIISYEESGFASLLIHQDPAILKDYINRVLGNLLLDRKKKIYLETLEAYFKCNFSLKEASLILSTHKNTITNRIHNIESMLGSSFDKSDFRVSVETALMANKLLQIL